MSCFNTVHALLHPPGAFSSLGHCGVMLAAQRGPLLHPSPPCPLAGTGRKSMGTLKAINKRDVEEIHIVKLCDRKLSNCVGCLTVVSASKDATAVPCLALAITSTVE
jgi:hypothetical protein